MNELVDKDLQFYSFNDFFKKKEQIREKYKLITDKKEKRIYKMYVYSLCFETEHTKDVIWEYLNSLDEFTDLQINVEQRNRIKKYKRKE